MFSRFGHAEQRLMMQEVDDLVGGAAARRL